MPASLGLEPTAEEALLDDASTRTRQGRGARDRAPLAARGSDALEAHHRPFIRWALVLTLLLGAGWGAHLLFEIGYAGRFDAVSASDVVAHGMAQLWGFVALFIVGVTLRYLPITTGRAPASLAARRTILSAIVLGVAASYLWSLRPAAFAWLGPSSGVLLMLGALGHVAFLHGQLRGRRGPFPLALAISGLWLLAWSGFTLGLAMRSSAAGPGAFAAHERLVLMELPLFGVALGSVYAVGQRLLPGFLACRAPTRSALLATVGLHNVGLLLLVNGRLLVEPAFVAAGMVLVLVGATVFVVALRGSRGREIPSLPRHGPRVLARTIRIALVWLPLSLGTMAVLALAEAVGGTALPHAYQGAARHAFTVGFLVTFMLGVGQRLLPILGGRPLARPAWANPILVLLSAGNLMRITTQVATAQWPVAYSILPLSSVLELLAIVLFAVSAWRTMGTPAPSGPSRRSP